MASNILCAVLERCDSPGIPDNGFLDTTVWPEGATISYTCRQGFQVVGDATRTCQRGLGGQLTWSGSLPICQGMVVVYRQVLFCAIFNTTSKCGRINVKLGCDETYLKYYELAL